MFKASALLVASVTALVIENNVEAEIANLAQRKVGTRVYRECDSAMPQADTPDEEYEAYDRDGKGYFTIHDMNAIWMPAKGATVYLKPVIMSMKPYGR